MLSSSASGSTATCPHTDFATTLCGPRGLQPQASLATLAKLRSKSPWGRRLPSRAYTQGLSTGRTTFFTSHGFTTPIASANNSTSSMPRQPHSRPSRLFAPSFLGHYPPKPAKSRFFGPYLTVNGHVYRSANNSNRGRRISGSPFADHRRPLGLTHSCWWRYCVFHALPRPQHPSATRLSDIREAS